MRRVRWRPWRAMTRIPGLALVPGSRTRVPRPRMPAGACGSGTKSDRLPRHPGVGAAGDRVVLLMALRRSARVSPRAAGRLEARVRVRGVLRDFELLLPGSDLCLQRLADCAQGICADAHLAGLLVSVAAPGVDRADAVCGAHARRRADGVGADFDRLSLPNGFDGVGRFTAVLFPVFIALAMLLRTRAAFVAVCAVFRAVPAAVLCSVRALAPVL